MLEHQPRRHSGLLVRLLRAALIAALIWPAPVLTTSTRAAAQTTADESSLKAAFIYQFAKFTTWPADAFSSSPKTINFCVIGKHELGSAFDKLLGKAVDGRPVELKYLDRLKKDDVCNVIYIAPSEKNRLKKIVEASAVGHALTVSDLEGFADSGGMIRLVKVNDTIKFEINPKAAQDAGLKLSSALLDLAIRIVR